MNKMYRRKGVGDSSLLRKGIALVLVGIMLFMLLPDSIYKSKAEEMPEYSNLFSWDGEYSGGRTYIYDGESLTFSGLSGNVKWTCNDVQNAVSCSSNGGVVSGNAEVTYKGSRFTITGVAGTEEGAEVTVRAELEGYGYKEVALTVYKNNVFYFMKDNKRIMDSSLSLSVDGSMMLTTNQKQEISFANQVNHITWETTTDDNYTYKISNTSSKNETTTAPTEPVVATSSFSYEDEKDGLKHIINLSLDIHVIDNVNMSMTGEAGSITMEKGTEKADSTYQLMVEPSNTSNPITWKVYKGKLTPAEALELESQDSSINGTVDNFTITPSTSNRPNAISKLNDVGLITINKDLELSKEPAGRVYTVIASQKTYEERVMNAVCYVTVQQPVTDVNLSVTETTLYLVGNGEAGNRSTTVSATPIGDLVNGIEADNKDLVWTCSDSSVVDIKANGTACTVNAKYPGHCVVVASSKTNPDANDVLYIEVVPKVSIVDIVNPDMTVNLAEKYVQLYADVKSNAVEEKKDTEDYDAYLAALNTRVYWTSSNPSIAEVDMYTGKVTLKSAGKVTITCTSADDQYIADSIVLTINVPVASIALYYTHKKIGVGESFTLDYTLLSDYPDFEPSNKEVTWESSDSKVATVDNDGKVTGVAGGTATILVRADDGQVTATCTVEVYQAVARIDISDTTMDLNLGEEAVLEAMIYPSTASEQKVVWESNKPDIVSVSQDGVIQAKKVGDPVVITAYIVDKNSTIKATCIVNVVVPVTSLSLSPASKTMKKGETMLLSKSITPKDATNSSVIYASTNTKVATVDSKGIVSAVAGGNCYITARTANRDIMASVYITVDEKVKSVKLNTSSKVMKKGKKYTLKATVGSSTATEKSVNWSSSNSKVATVSSKGVVTAKGYGTCKIVATAMDGSGKKATCKITVRRYVQSIHLNKKSLTLKVKKSYLLKPKISPSNADVKKLKWTSSNSKIASVKNGKIRAKAVGTCTITVKSLDGSGKSAKCKVTVKKVLTDVDLVGKKK